MLSAKYEANYSLTMRCLLVFLSSLLSIIPAQEYDIKIERRVTTYNETARTWIVQPDSFEIPICGGDDSAKCKNMGGEQIGGSCTCECSLKRNDVFYKSTFGFYDSEWKCEENTRIRSGHEDCSTTTLNVRQLNSSLITLPISSSVDNLFLSANLTIKCGLYPKAGSYLGCDGFWWEIDQAWVQSRFSTSYRDDRLYLNYNDQPLSSFINGRVIKLRIECFDHKPYNVPSSKHCVLLKVEGQLICPVSVTQPTTRQPSSLPSLQSTTSTISKQTSAQVTKTRSVSSGTSTINMTLVPDKENDKTGGNTADHSGVIAGSLAGVIVLVIVIVAIVAIRRQMKNGRSEGKTANTAIENETYERGVDNSLSLGHGGKRSDDEYSYAYNNAAPFVKTKGRGNNNTELRSSVSNHSYGTIEALSVQSSPPSSDAPIYNTLDEPEYEKPDIRHKNEPLYNVLEKNEEPPCYDVLEGPFPNGTAVYDKLQRPFEAPNSKEVPAYRALEGHDPHVYGTLTTSNQAKGPAEDNTELDDADYDCVGDMIMRELPQSTNIYHQLNQHGQQNNHGQNQFPRDQDTSHSQA